MNEATLEANLNRTLDQLFRGPLRVKIEHQKHLSLRVGHHEITVDGERRSEARGRLDVLLMAEDRNLAVLEIKRKDLELTEEDETQAWSYARLLHPMPPFYILTNGKETRIFRTYDRQKLDAKAIDEATLAGQIAAAAGAASEDASTAIRFLLGHSPEVFKQLFRKVTDSELGFLTGSAVELMKPLAANFRFSREGTALLRAAILQKRPLIVLVGPPLSGKTNIAAELCETSYDGPPLCQKIVPLYVNCSQRPQGVFQSLATGLTKQTAVPATAEDVRHWVTVGRLTSPDDCPAIILDAWPLNAPERWEAELAELLDLASANTFTLVVVLDEAQAERLLTDPHRGQHTRLGNLAHRVAVNALLSHRELAVAAHFLSQTNNLLLEQGAEHNILYRYPQTWRLLTCSPQVPGVVPAVIGVEFIHAARDIIKPSAEHWDALRRFALAIVEEDLDGPLAEVLLGSPGWAALETAQKLVGESGLTRLQEAGFVRVRSGPHDTAFLSAQIPTLIASAGASLLGDRLKEAIASSSPTEATDRLVRECMRFPLGAIVGAAAVRALGPALALDIIRELLLRKPKIGRATAESRLALLLEGENALELPPDIVRQSIEEGADHLYGDPLPYLILSYVARTIDTEHAASQKLFFLIADEVGSVGMPILPVHHSPREMRRIVLPLSMHDLPDGRSFLCHDNGVVEPITDALRSVALAAPDAFEAFAHELLAREVPPFPLLYRISIAVRFVAHLETPLSARMELLEKALSDKIQERIPIEFRFTP